MMFVIRKMFNSTDLKDYKIVLLIDRKDLQSQLFKTTKAIKFAVNEAGSVEGFKKLIQNTASDVTVAMVHKFGERKETVGKFPVLNKSNRILVMIDEAPQRVFRPCGEHVAQYAQFDKGCFYWHAHH